MKKLSLLLLTAFASTFALAQQQAAPMHGMIFGTKPGTTAVMAAAKLEGYMGNKNRLGTVITGKILKVTQSKGGWFEIDAGNGAIIAAHFKKYDINLPGTVAGHTAIIDGVAQKQFIADDQQHLAGDTATGKKQHDSKPNPKNHITFEVNGLMIK